MSFILGVAVYTVGMFFLTTLCMGGNAALSIRAFFDGSTIYAFLFVIVSVLLATNGFKTFVRAINALLSNKYSISAADKERAVRLFKLIGKSVIITTVLTTVMALIAILYTLYDPSMLGPKVALAILSIFHGTFILLIIAIAIHNLQTRYNTEEKTVISEKQVIDKLLELCYKQGISPEEILDANEIYFRKNH